MKLTLCFFFFRSHFIRTLQLYMHFDRKKFKFKFKNERKCLSAYVNIARSSAQQKVIGRCRRMGTLCFLYWNARKLFICSLYRTVPKIGWTDTRSNWLDAQTDTIKMMATKTKTGLVQYAWLLNDDVLRSHTERVHHFIKLILMNNVGAHTIYSTIPLNEEVGYSFEFECMVRLWTRHNARAFRRGKLDRHMVCGLCVHLCVGTCEGLVSSGLRGRRYLSDRGISSIAWRRRRTWHLWSNKNPIFCLCRMINERRNGSMRPNLNSIPFCFVHFGNFTLTKTFDGVQQKYEIKPHFQTSGQKFSLKKKKSNDSIANRSRLKWMNTKIRRLWTIVATMRICLPHRGHWFQRTKTKARARQPIRFVQNKRRFPYFSVSTEPKKSGQDANRAEHRMCRLCRVQWIYTNDVAFVYLFARKICMKERRTNAIVRSKQHSKSPCVV